MQLRQHAGTDGGAGSSRRLASVAVWLTCAAIAGGRQPVERRGLPAREPSRSHAHLCLVGLAASSLLLHCLCHEGRPRLLPACRQCLNKHWQARYSFSSTDARAGRVRDARGRQTARGEATRYAQSANRTADRTTWRDVINVDRAFAGGRARSRGVRARARRKGSLTTQGMIAPGGAGGKSRGRRILGD